MIVRLVVVLALVAVVFAARLWLAGRFRRDDRRELPEALFPEWVTGGADRTWVVFSTPYCATCGPVAAELASADPGAHVEVVDATEHPGLADAFGVRRSPTVFATNATGRPELRLTGAEAVREHLATLVT